MEIARVLLIYGLLLGGSMIFALPFVWMIGTSFKVDREMFGEKITLWPMTPIPATKSPYLDTRYYRAPDDGRYEQVRPMILDVLKNVNLSVPDYVDGRAKAAEVLAPGMFKRLAGRLPTAVWQKPEDELLAAVRGGITSELIEETRRNVMREFTLGQVRVRSEDLQEAEVTQGHALSKFWTVGTKAGARLVDIQGGATEQANVVYDFSAGTDTEVRLSRTLDLPFRAERLFRVMIFLRPDDS